MWLSVSSGPIFGYLNSFVPFQSFAKFQISPIFSNLFTISMAQEPPPFKVMAPHHGVPALPFHEQIANIEAKLAAIDELPKLHREPHLAKMQMMSYQGLVEMALRSLARLSCSFVYFSEGCLGATSGDVSSSRHGP